MAVISNDYNDNIAKSKNMVKLILLSDLDLEKLV